MVSLIGGSNVNAMEVRLAGDATDLNSTLDDAATSIGAFKAQVAAMGTTMAIVSGGAMAGATAVAERWNETQREMTKVTNPEVAQELGDSIRGMSREIPVATNELGKLAADAARFGIEGQANIESFVESVSKMSAATQLTTEEAGESFAKLAELTDTPVPKVENLGSSIAELENNMATSAQEIVKNSLRSSATLSQLGLQQHEILGLSAAINEVSHSARRAGTALRRVAQDMMNPSKVSVFAEALGMTAEEFTKMRDENPKEALLALTQTMKDGGEGAEILQGGLTSLSRRSLNKLAQNADGVNEALEISKNQFEENTALQREYEIQTDSLTANLKRLKNSLEDTAITIGNVFVPYLKEAIANILPVLDAFNEWVDESEGLAPAIALLSTFVFGLSTALGALVSMGPPVTTVLYGITAATASIYASLAPIVGLIAAVGYAWKSNFGGMRDAALNVGGVLREEVMKTLPMFLALVNSVLGTVNEAWRKHQGTVAMAVTSIVDFIEGGLISGIRAAGKAVRNAINSMRFWWLAHGDAVVSTVGSFLREVHGLFTDIFSLIYAVVQGRMGDAEVAYTRVLTRFSQYTDTILGGLSVYFDSALNNIESSISSSNLSPFWKATLMDLVTITEATTSIIGNIWSGNWSNIATSFFNLGGSIIDIATRTFDRLRTVVSSRMSGIEGDIISSNIPSSVKTALAGALSVVRTVTDLIKAAWRGEWGKLKDITQSALNSVHKVILSAGGQLKAAAKSTAQKAFTKFEEESSKAVAGTRKAWAELPPGVRSSLQPLVQVFNEHKSTVGEMRASIAGIVSAVAEHWRTHKDDVRDIVITLGQVITQKYANAIDTLLTTLNTTLAKANTLLNNHKSEVSSAIDTVANAFRKYKKEIKTIGPVLLALGTSIGLIKGPLSGLVATAISAKGAMVGWGVTIKSLMATALVPLKGAITMIVAKIIGFSSAVMGIGTAITATIGKAGAFLSFLSSTSGITASLTATLSGLPGMLGSVGGSLTMLTGTFSSLAGAVGTASVATTGVMALLTGFAAPVAIAIGAIALFNQQAKKDFKGVKSTAKAMMTGIKRILKEGFKLLNTAIVKPALTIAKNLYKAHKNNVLRIFRTMRTIAETVIGDLSSIWKQNSQEITNIVRNLTKTLGTLLKIGLDILIPITQTFLNNVLSIWRKLQPKLQSILNTVFTLVDDVISTALKNLKLLWNQHGQNIVSTLERFLNMAMQTIRGVLVAILEIVDPLLKRLLGFWRNNKEEIMTIVRALVGLLVTVFTGVANTLMNIIGPLLNWISKKWDKHGDKIITLLEFAFDTVLSVVGAALDTLATVIKSVTAAMNGDWDKALSLIMTTAKDIFNGIIEWLRKWGGGLLEWITGLLGDVIQGFIDFGQDLIFGSTVKDIFNEIFNFVEKTLGNLAEKISNILGGIKETVGNLFGKAKDLVVGAIETVKKTVRKGFNTAKDKAGSALEGMKGKVDSIAGDIEGIFSGAMDTVSGIADDIVGAAEGAMQDAQDALGDARSAAGNAADKATSAANSAADAAGSAANAAGDAASNYVPGLAEGGIVTGPTPAVVGEGSANEAVIPLNHRGRAMLTEAMGGAGKGGGTTIEKIEVHADSRQAGRRAGKALSRELKSHNFNNE